ncbi:hypothetical protein CKAN_00750500 [Cinnamomum micranthum f. kanehirae]|uniref:Plant/T31B5-30 protein n=1 Tax=Cinnamomum micranthum f. kanehirae TaxID=337451 RepID=A0A3S3M8F0_9MAGN|nr:hypothetical protein CKAN_00750500 [Cinnamomum micranthum f. kanehirae]
MASPLVFFGPLPSPAPSRKRPSLLSPFINAVTSLFNINNNLVLEEEEEAVLKPKPQPPMRPMETPSRYSLSSGDPCLDLFNVLLQEHDTPPPETLRELLRRAWAHNPLTTLKIILRRGRSLDMEVLYTVVVFWLHQNHPKTLALNVRWFTQFGYMPYLLKILFREVAPPDALEIEKEERELRQTLQTRDSDLRRRGLERIFAEKERLRPELARRVVERYESDSNYRLLYDRISDFFAESLKTDIGYLNSCELLKIGRAAKWCPSLDSSLDYSTLLCESIAKRVFPRESDPSYAQMDESHYSCTVRKRLWKEIHHPLLIRFRWPWHKVSEWEPEEIAPLRTPVRAWLILSFQSNNMDEVMELRWKRMVEDLSKEGKLSNCLSVCDVSRSMGGTPMEVCVALGLLASELSEEPWRGNVINFSQNPQLHRIEGETLQEKVKFIERMEWETDIDFQKVFDRILDVAVASKLEEAKMVKRVFVFSDMGFGEASENSWETDYYAIQRKYEEKGYGSSVPEIVFWNFGDRAKPPVIEREKGVVLVHGFSDNLLNIFLDNGGVLNPEDLMEEEIAGEEYQRFDRFAAL